MSALRFADCLARELEARRAKNPRYSLRAFAAYLGTDHSTLSQILRQSRRAPARQIRAWARKLSVDAEEAGVWIAVEHGRADAEVLGILTERAHWQILELIRAPEFRADSRWLAERIGVPADTVNIALSRLLRLGLLEMRGNRWIERTGLIEFTEKGFRRLALRRAREATWQIR
jgi:DNA-binding MarR family transcriptional regulator